MTQQEHHLVHANVALMRAPLDDPMMAEFVHQMDEIDASARNAAGFVAQPVPPDEGRLYTGRALLNLSIWQSVEDLDRFTHSGPHALALERRTEWFEQAAGPNYVLYWAPVGHMPTEVEIKERLDHLAMHGPTPFAFNFERRFTAADSSSFRLEGN